LRSRSDSGPSSLGAGGCGISENIRKIAACFKGSFRQTVCGVSRLSSGSRRASCAHSAVWRSQPEFYLRNGFFWVKMALFLLVLALEMYPMYTFIQWRVRRCRGRVPTAGANFRSLIACNDAEVGIVVLIPFAAALMARGAWLF
jgi:hypothetical protein